MMLNPRQILTFAPWQDVRFGSKADICGATDHVRFTPNSDRKSGFLHKVMSALPLKADMCAATSNVGFGPKADITLTAPQKATLQGAMRVTELFWQPS
jgi:hypothetical protein